MAAMTDLFDHVHVYRPVPAALVFMASDEPLDLFESAPRALERAGEDFGRYTLDDRSVPAVMFWLGAVDPEVHASGAPLPSLHSPLFAPSADLAIETGVTAMTGAVLDLMSPDAE